MNPRLVRSFALAGSLLLALCLTSCGDAPRADEGDPATTGPASFVAEDARGTTVDLDTVPETVVAQSSVAAALWDAGYQVDAVYGELGDVDGALNYQAGSIDLDQVEVLGKTWGEFSVEQLAAVRPDLLIDFSMDGSTLWYVPPEQIEEVETITPTLAVSGQDIGTTDEAIGMFTDLAAKLGADVKAPAVTAARAEYDAALADVAAAVADRDLEVLLVSRSADTLWLANPDDFPEIRTLAAAGVHFIGPDIDPGTFFQETSWEELGKYADADVIFYDARETPDTAAAVDKVATWRNLPAVEAGQVHEWRTAAPYSYLQYAGIYADLAEALAASHDLG